MKLVTVATHSDGFFPYLEASCKRFDAKLVVLGWQQEWKGFSWRFKLMRDYVTSLPADEIVCFIDAYDVILLRPLEELEQIFRAISQATGADLVTACHQAASHFKLATNYLFGQCLEKPLNAGTYIGYKESILNMLKWTMSVQGFNDNYDDQALLTRYCSAHGNSVFVDCDAVIFMCKGRTLSTILDKDLRVHQGLLVYKGTRPFVLHGFGVTNMIPVIEALGYRITPAERQRINKYMYTTVMKKIKLYFLYSLWKPALLILLIIVALIWLVQYNKSRKKG